MIGIDAKAYERERLREHEREAIKKIEINCNVCIICMYKNKAKI